ncbi:MAG: alkene reductase [Sphingomicrobium sp.]
MPTLFDPLALGALTLPNRIIMAPLTRGRASPEGVHGQLAVEYYRQRASAGLIISEATGISREGLGWPYAPGLWTAAQVEGWKPVTAAVHQGGGRIVAQLWHMGRLVHASLGGGQPVSASATTAPGHAHSYNGKQPYEQARGASLDDIARIIGEYALAARNAMAAGFDGVQIHSANGYLIDQFLRASDNHREDDYGGSIDNRMRLALEVIDAVAQEVGIERTGIRFSPNAVSQGIDDPAPEPLFVALARALEKRRVPWFELREPGSESSFGAPAHPAVSPAMRSVYSGRIILNSDYVGDSAQARLDEGVADGIAFGRPFIANPDLVERLRQGAPLNIVNPDSLYVPGPEGYTDYPMLAEQAVA